MMHEHGHGHEVSILVVLEYLLNNIITKAKQKDIIVSILVVLEYLLN